MGSWLADVAVVIERGINASSDPRVGSARDNGTSTSALRVGQGTNSASFETLFMTFVPTAIYAVVCLTFFCIFRSRLPRVYAPRTFLRSLERHERIEALPRGWFKWVKAFYNVPDIALLEHSSLDGFLFLRYLKILTVICGVGCIITWPVLLPLHRYGGNGNKQLDMLTFGNIKNPVWYYVPAIQAWLFFGFILYMISRECVYFINLRQAYLLSPYYADRLSSRTVLFTCVPQQILEEKKLRRVFGESARHIWIPRETEELDDLVKEREKTAVRLEKAEITLIKKVNEAYVRASKQGHPDIIKGRWSEDSTAKDADMSVTSITPTTPRSVRYRETDNTPTSQRSVRYKEAEMDVLSTTTSPPSMHQEDDIVLPISPASPREFPRSDGTPGLKTSYGFDGPPPDVNGSVAAQWIPYSWRPVHRPLANYGRKVDTIKWCRQQLKEMAPKISKLRRLHKKGVGRPFPAVFVEFDTQANAQSAYQTLAHHRANHMAPDIVGVRPQEIIWSSLKLHWWERIIRRFAIQAAIAAMVVFWSLPAAFVGTISQIKYLTHLIPFLGWINKLPSIVLGLISGLLPAVALSLLMSLVPIIMRACARQAGVTTISKVELFTQNAYFVFQVVQVFLVTTLTSAVSGAIQNVIKDPTSTPKLLSQNLPKASNFYVSYFILQGLAMSSTRLVHLGSIFRHQFMAMAGGKPRLIARKYHRLRIIHWGSIYPVFTNMGVIAISYALIAPLILGVAFIGLNIIYVTYRYNLFYIYSSENDARGLHYPRALKQTFMGVYLAEICMVGLFGLGKSFGPLVLMLALLIFTGLVHFSLTEALSPLLYNLPRTLAVEEELRRAGHEEGLGYEDKHSFNVDPEDHDAYDSDFDPSAPTAPTHGETIDRGHSITGGKTVLKLTTTGLTTYVRLKYAKSPIPAFINRIDFWTYWISPSPSITNPNFLLKWLHPEVFADYAVLRKTVPAYPEIIYEEGVVKDAYYPPSLRARPPRLWIPRDVAGVSAQEVAHSGKVVPIGDEGASIDRKGRLMLDLEGTEGDRREEWERMRF